MKTRILILSALVGITFTSCVQITEVEPRWPGRFQHDAIDAVCKDNLRETIQALSYPRSHGRLAANQRARDWVKARLENYGYTVSLQGGDDNVVALPPGATERPPIVLGAHYDTVYFSPGADDNASGVAVCLEAARVLRLHGLPAQVIIFNREEEGLLGSSQYVMSLTKEDQAAIRETHIFETVGYFTSQPNTQKTPPELEQIGVRWRSTGDFIGLLSNSGSNRIASNVIRNTKKVGSRTHLSSMKVRFGLENKSGNMLRSDHASFWKAGIPAVMWTDTADFRNPNYHRTSDLPHTVNEDALTDVTRIAVGHIVKTLGGR